MLRDKRLQCSRAMVLAPAAPNSEIPYQAVFLLLEAPQSWDCADGVAAICLQMEP